MKVPPSSGGVAFTESADGDVRRDLTSRSQVSASLGIPEQWAVVRQVHGAIVRRVSRAGDAGDGDAIWTNVPGLPVAVFTADCFGVVLTANDAVGVAHAGWRGVDAGVIAALRDDMTQHGSSPARAYVGAGIGPCCFEVGEDVAVRFEGHRSKTTWGTTSVDLPAVMSEELIGLDTWYEGGCTMHEPGWFSHRQAKATERMAAIGWL